MPSRTLTFLLFALLLLTCAPLVSAQDDVAPLSEIYIAPRGAFLLRYPQGWEVAESRDSTFEMVRAYDEILSIIHVPDTGTTPSASLSDMIDTLLADDQEVIVPVTSFVLNGHMAAYAEFKGINDRYYTSYAMSMALNGVLFRMMLVTPVETHDELIATATQIFGSLQTPQSQPAGRLTASEESALPQRYTSESGDLSFNLPSDWYVYESPASENNRIYLYGMSPDGHYFDVSIRLSDDVDRSLIDFLGVGVLSSVFADETLTPVEFDGYEAVRLETVDPLLDFNNGLKLGVDLGAFYVQFDVSDEALTDPGLEPLLSAVFRSLSTPNAGRNTRRGTPPTWAARIAGVELPQQFQSSDGVLTFDYPQSWRIRESEGEVWIVGSEGVLPIGTLSDDSTSVRQLLNDFERDLTGSVTLADSTQLLVDGRLMGYNRIQNRNGSYQTLYAARVDRTIVYMHAETGQPNPALDATVFAMLSSVTLDLPPKAEGLLTVSGDVAFPQRYTTANGLFSFNLPEGWQVMDREVGGVTHVLLMPPDGKASLDVQFVTETRYSIEDIASLGYAPALYTDMTQEEFVSNGYKGVRVEMLNADVDFLRVLNLAVNFGNGNIVITRVSDTLLDEYDWETMLMALFDSVEVGAGRAGVAAPSGDTAASVSACTVTSSSNANLRGGPGTDFTVTGSLLAGTSEPASGQATGRDGFIWWQLDSGAWVRSDVVSEIGDCAALPTVESF